ncbi:nitroreductase family protein [Massilia sp. DWR3-1-1]|uniref:nitroreductase family protein n=1 Tax=Massilia sp. DWR3-1-1 TaxID=2804559 RepID=UPI003CE6F3C4
MSTPTLLSADADLHQLPPHEAASGMTALGQALLQVLAQRHSEREFAPTPLSTALLGQLLWAAGGVNRDDTGLRTNPTAKNWQEIDVYVAREDGLFLYEAAGNALRKLSSDDLRGATGWQDFVAQAPVNLVYVADLARMDHAPTREQKFYAALDTGYISQNVYLFCAAQGLATVARAWVDRPALAGAMHLREGQRIILAQSVGYPRHPKRSAGLPH